MVDIKHRRQFTESPQQISNRLEQNLSVDINASEAEVNTPTPEKTPKPVIEPTPVVDEPKEEPAPEPVSPVVTESLEESATVDQDATKVEADLEEFLNNINNTIEPGE